MSVAVQFYGVQKALTKTHELRVPIQKGRKVRDVLNYLSECYPDLVIREDDVVITVNNRISSMDRTLKPDDRVSFLPHIGGG